MILVIPENSLSYSRDKNIFFIFIYLGENVGLVLKSVISELSISLFLTLKILKLPQIIIRESTKKLGVKMN